MVLQQKQPVKPNPLLTTLTLFTAAKKYRDERISEAYKGKGEEDSKKEGYGRSFKDVSLTLKTIFTNPVWILLTVSGFTEAIGISGLGAFLPKMMQFQFAQPPAQAAIYGGECKIII